MNILEVFAISLGVVASALAPVREEISVPVGDTKRTALVDAPATTPKDGLPVVLCFHGHGGNMRQAARSFEVSKHWPEALVVYPQGLATVTARDPKGERAGWQNREGLSQDRDLKFVDQLLVNLGKKYRINRKRIFAMGHSNGGGFTYLLMRARPAVFAGFGPSAANGSPGRGVAKPTFHMAGRNDPLVTFAAQERTLDALYAKSNLTGVKEAWSKECTYHPSKSGTPVATYITDARHEFQKAAVPYMVRFFKSL